MSTPTPRRFTLLDGPILIAATAPGVLAIRAIWPELRGFWIFEHGAQSRWTDPEIWDFVFYLGCTILPCVLAWTLTLPALRLCRPHPTVRRLARQPGMVACVAVAQAVVLIALALGAGILLMMSQAKPISWPKDEQDWLMTAGEYLTIFSPLVAMTVVGAWASLALGGRWRPERDWIDRAGRFLGATWLVTGFALGVYWISELLL